MTGCGAETAKPKGWHFPSAIGALSLILNSGVVLGQVVVGPGDQTGAAGSVTEFAFSLQRNGADVAIFGFNILIGGDEVYVPVLKERGERDEIDCTIENDLDDFINPLAFYLPDAGIIAISFGDLTFPLTHVDRDGVIGRCKFFIRIGTEPGDYPLPCDPAIGATSASDAGGNGLDIVCVNGTLRVLGGAPTPTTWPEWTPTMGEGAERPPMRPTTLAFDPVEVFPNPWDSLISGSDVGESGERDGCNLAKQEGGGIAWALLVPAAFLTLYRRRARSLARGETASCPPGVKQPDRLSQTAAQNGVKRSGSWRPCSYS